MILSNLPAEPGATDDDVILVYLTRFFNAIYDFMHIELHWAGFTFTLWEAFTLTIIVSVTGYMVGAMLHKDD